jgi:DNA repair exonuclease SbcCD ATPase subunit
MTDSLKARIEAEIQRITNRLEILTSKINNYEGNEQVHRREKRKLIREQSAYSALLAVLELHLEEYESVSDAVYGNNPVCSCGASIYPCLTIQTIERELT